jgi:hypothetical protein
MSHADTELFSEPLIEYLQKLDWHLALSEPDIAVLRKEIDGQEEELLLPIDRRFADYQQRVLEAIWALAKYERISEKSILEDLLFQQWDVLRIRITGEKIGVGFIPYLEKTVIEENVKKVLLAAASYVAEPKPYFKRLRPSTEWITQCRAGVAEPGSYILTIQMPLQKSDLFEPPFSRRVAEYLMGSLGKLVEPGDAKEGLNANFCLGIAEMKPDATPIQFDFEMKWSPLLPVQPHIPSKVAIQDHHFASIAAFGQKLIPQSRENQDLFIGKVQVLHGEPDDDGRMQGEATLVLFVDDQPIKATGFFGPETYAQVCDAHKANRYIRIFGMLSEKARCSELKNITSLEIF